MALPTKRNKARLMSAKISTIQQKNDRETATNTISTIHTTDKVPLYPLQSPSLAP